MITDGFEYILSAINTRKVRSLIFMYILSDLRVNKFKEGK